MKRLIFSLLLALCCLPGSAQPAMKLAPLSHNFGSLDPQADPVSHTFELENTGDEPLVILRVETGCRCTSATYPRRPVAPGEKAQISVTYDPKGQKGPFLKTIQLFSNTPEKRHIISVQGQVVK